jgi:2-amino-4-hydroxy-6-hydroxymethyldihydropteridine diphosphokinase
VDLESWLKRYRRICKELGILERDDIEARNIASQIITDKKQPLGKLESLIRNREALIFGAGPSLEEGVKKLSTEDRRQKTLIAADGATSCLLENGLYPDIVVTDLDGDIKDLLLADRFGAIMVVHAHGDNIPAVKKTLPRFKNPVVTAQTEPLRNVFNFWGFTDGDRAVFLARHFGATKIDLIGFDFGETVGKYSKPENPMNHAAGEIKKKKLEIAEELISTALETL